MRDTGGRNSIPLHIPYKSSTSMVPEQPVLHVRGWMII